MKAAAKAPDGFTLVEVLMALGIVMLVTLFIIGMFSQAARVSSRSRNGAVALFLAQEKMEEILAESGAISPAESGTFSGKFSSYQFTVRISEEGAPKKGLKVVAVGVRSPAGAQARLVSLKTIHSVSIAAGGYHSLVCKDDGSAWSWGNDTSGQLGNKNKGISYSTRIPALVCGEAQGCGDYRGDAIRVAGGFSHSLILKADGTVLGFGGDSNGQLGIGEKRDCVVPALIKDCSGCSSPYITGVKAISASVSDDFSLALKKDGTVWAWGQDTMGQLGDNHSGDGVEGLFPTEVCEGSPNGFSGSCNSYLDHVSAISAGFGHSLALKQDGSVWAWGDDRYGQLGTGRSLTDSNGAVASSRPTPVQVCALTAGSSGTCEVFLDQAVSVSAGSGHSLALKEDGTVWAWGDNTNGQLGNNSALIGTASSVPVEVCRTPSGSSAKCLVPLNNVVAISAGAHHNLALRGDGTVWAWGQNTFGQLGNNSSGVGDIHAVPVEVCGTPGSEAGTCSTYLKDIIAIAAGNYHSLALKSNQTIWAWGNGIYGQLGNNDTPSRQSIPVETVRF